MKNNSVYETNQKKKIDTQFIISICLFIVPIILGIVYYGDLPSRMAVHFDSNNVANGFAPKWFALFGIPAILLAVHCICVLSIKHDPKKQGQPKVMKLTAFWLCPIIAIFIQIQFIAYGLGKHYNMSTYVMIILGILFIIIGNYLPKTRYNYTVGIKLPWTLSSEENWNKTHRFAGKMWVACGLTLMITAVVAKQSYIGLIILAVIIIIPALYSFILYVKKPTK